MSSPLGHSLVGYIVGVYESKAIGVKNFKTLLCYVLVANAPDLDFLPGLLRGRPNLFHHGISHSLGAALLFSLFLTVVLKYLGNKNTGKNFLTLFVLYASHILLDYLTVDERPPFGIPAFWPLSHRFILFPYPLLPPVRHSELIQATIGQFLDAVFSIHNLYVLSVEFGVMTLIMVVLLVLRGHWSRAR